MRRKIFYLIIAIGLSAILIYSLVFVSVLEDLDIQPINIARIKMLFGILIVIFESSIAIKWIRNINLFLLTISLIGVTFMILHWPFGHLIFNMSFLIIMVLLFINALKSIEYSYDKTLILIFPLSELLIEIENIYYKPFAFFVIDLFIIGLTAILFFNYARKLGRKITAANN